MFEDDDDKTIYTVVVNHEEQYSIWPADRDLPLGWKEVGKRGAKDDCLKHIHAVWTDMRPLSLRRKMAEFEERREEFEAEAARRAEEAAKIPPDPRDDLVRFLSEGQHPVEVSLRPEPTLERFRERIDSGYVHVRFTDTRGGTELGVRLDTKASDVASLRSNRGRVHLEGDLTLNYVPVRLEADIDLPLLRGTGRLVPTGS